MRKQFYFMLALVSVGIGMCLTSVIYYACCVLEVAGVIDANFLTLP